ncbi:MAG: TetR/AcrR family transcriptional regulator [Acidimicrobiales bacterium]
MSARYTGNGKGGRPSAAEQPDEAEGLEDPDEPERKAATGRRAEIESAALGLFLDRGFAATSVREIAGEVGVTVPTLYYHFGSKDGILAALVEGLVNDGEEVITDLAGRSGIRLPGRALASYYDVVTRHLDVFRLVMTDPSVRSHDIAGHRLAEQGSRFLGFLTNGSDRRRDVIRANAALGAIRRPLRLDDFDIEADRHQTLASARAALAARSGR